ncbi:MAG: phosphoserine phosphatase SerB [Methylovirgula sp.]|uniref:phosphoserine phosphatase SerB n=1 Tax=Methylovirgula sp. TaxID=1978224 RepID=UPI003076600A
MLSVATLVSPPGLAALDDRTLQNVARSIPGVEQTAWLDARIAADIFFDAPASAGLLGALRAGLAETRIDIFVQPVAHRRKKLLLADMDSTMIEQECLDELADFAGLRDHVAPITTRAMRGEIAFEPALRERVALLTGLDIGVIDEIVASRITLTPGAKMLVATMRAHGAFSVLVSGGFTAFTEKIAAMIGFDDHMANVLGVAGGKLTGHVEEPVLGRAAKREILEELCRRRDISAEDVIAVGDGANDLDMLESAGLGVAFHAKPLVAAAAQARVVYGDLTALLYAQGYSRVSFVA